MKYIHMKLLAGLSLTGKHPVGFLREGSSSSQAATHFMVYLLLNIGQVGDLGLDGAK